MVPRCMMLAVVVTWGTVLHTSLGGLIRDSCCGGGRWSLGFWERGFPGTAISLGLILLSRSFYVPVLPRRDVFPAVVGRAGTLVSAPWLGPASGQQVDAV